MITESKKASKGPFYLKVILGLIVIMSALMSVTYINDVIPGGLGLTIALLFPICMGIGVTLLYFVVADRINLKILNHFNSGTNKKFIDGEIIGFCGEVHCEGEPMISPFTDTACAAYTYSISKSVSKTEGGTRSFLLAMGLHMNKTKIHGKSRVLNLFSFPSFEDDLRFENSGTQFAKQVNQLLAKFYDDVDERSLSQHQANLSFARNNHLDQIHQDFCQSSHPTAGTIFSIKEEILPVDVPVCVVGTYDERRQGINGCKTRFGQNLMIYKGDINNVIIKLESETSTYLKVAMVFIAIGLSCLGYAIFLSNTVS